TDAAGVRLVNLAAANALDLGLFLLTPTDAERPAVFTRFDGLDSVMDMQDEEGPAHGAFRTTSGPYWINVKETAAEILRLAVEAKRRAASQVRAGRATDRGDPGR
ncbi:hypothetical protein HN937_12285, partial [Candidatus Poribacteria bacterium]|nr:hypothetical protein [Candidatus Poribacteria bacterium]